MSAELRIPEGIVVRTARGGPDVLRSILNDLKQYSFSGYVKVILKKQTINSTGYLVIDQGKPSMSIYQFEKMQPREIKRIYAGDRSMRFVWEDSQDKMSLIELHSRVPKEEFDRRFPDAKLLDAAEIQSRMEKPGQASKGAVPAKTPAPAMREIEDEPSGRETDRTYQEIEKWRQEGFIVAKLEEVYKINKSAAKKEVAKYAERIRELKKLEKLLDSMPKVGMEEEIEQMKKRLNDPADLENIKIDYEALKERVRKQIEQTKMAERRIEEDLKKKKREEQVGDLYDLILQYQRGEGAQKEAPICEKCGGALDKKGICPKCSQKKEEVRTELPPETQTFESFVVGASNKFAHAAAIAVSQAPDKAYNPLFLYGKSGLGKTHLLTAISRQLMLSHSPGSVAFISAEKFAEDLDRALKKDTVSEFRDQLRNKIGLLIDDFQFLTGKGAAQDELLYILDETKRSGGQIVIASDRLPKEIPNLSEQLSAKIQGGLIADIQPPDEVTRIEILRRKAKEKGQSIPGDVLKYISDNITANVRELEAALNRLIAFASVMKVGVDLQLAREVLAPTLTAGPVKKEETIEVDVKPSHSYLVEEDRPIASNKIFAKMVKEGFSGLEITRMNPAQVRQEFDLNAEILWLTDKDSKNEKTVAPSLESIVHKIESFVQSNPKGILLIDGLQYLISNTNFDGVLRFIRRLIDDFSESQSIMMISVSPGTLKPQEVSILERELETIKPPQA